MQLRHDAKEVTQILGRTFCWASGISTRPKFWHAPWYMQAAHLGSGSGSMFRINDRRMVICLSPLLHHLHVADRKKIPRMSVAGREWPTIDNANAIWIKSVWDPDYFDPDFIEEAWNGKPPTPEPPHEYWAKLLNDNVGMKIHRESEG